MALAVAIFLLAAIVIGWPWLSGRVTIPWDAKAHFQPQIQFLAQSLARGFFDHGSASFGRRSFGEACLGRRGVAGGDGKLLRQLRRFGRSEGLCCGRSLAGSFDALALSPGRNCSTTCGLAGRAN